MGNRADQRGKELLLVRHAKSSWDDHYLDDHDRPLNERGLQNAPEMGKRLQGLSIRPEVWISSTALRAITTAEIIANKSVSLRIKSSEPKIFTMPVPQNYRKLSLS